MSTYLYIRRAEKCKATTMLQHNYAGPRQESRNTRGGRQEIQDLNTHDLSGACQAAALIRPAVYLTLIHKFKQDKRINIFGYEVTVSQLIQGIPFAYRVSALLP